MENRYGYCGRQNDQNNQVSMAGKVSGDFRRIQNRNGGCFYITRLSARRLSDYTDRIPLLIPESLVDPGIDWRGKTVAVEGQFRSCNFYDRRGMHLLLFVYVGKWEVRVNSETPDSEDDINDIHLNGYVCREPVYRRTPLGREITDVMLAVNRSRGETDYIPGICWGRNARYAARELEVGSRVEVQGRIQSRYYTKEYSSEVREKRTAYEVSVNRIRPVAKQEERRSTE